MEKGEKAMTKINPPCYRCERRVLGCHSSCADYKMFREEHLKQKYARIEAKNKDRVADHYRVSIILRCKKKKNISESLCWKKDI
jgi:hypothetical protein